MCYYHLRGFRPQLLCSLQVGPLPVGDDTTYVQQYDDGHIPWVKRPGDDLGDTGAMVWAYAIPERFLRCTVLECPARIK